MNLKEGYNKTFKNILTINVDLLRTANPHLNKCFETLSLTFWGRSLVKRRYGLHSNSRGANEIKSIDFAIETRSCYSCLVLYLHDSPFAVIIIIVRQDTQNTDVG